ncbi:MAG: AAA family ATPase [Alphaproteobacteria bacterium]|nr:AAA family ATPase [Alphaproteobacteria bacterium]
MDVETWLKGLGLERYADRFAAGEVTWPVLPRLTDDDLRELGLPLGPRKILLPAIEALRTAAARQAAADPERAPPPAHEIERRHLTVMFVDLADSTALSAAHDAEDLLHVLRRYQDDASAAIRRRDGFLAKFMGDGVLAYFGYPQAYEDAAERAVHAALDIIAAVQSMPALHGQPLAVRVAVASGPVIVGDIVGEELAREINIVGATPNLAARLLAVAPENGLVIADSTRRLLGDLFSYRDLGPQTFKGIPEPVPAYLVLGERRGMSRFEAVRTAPRNTFVGRNQELDLLRENWQRAAAGHGRLVLVSGEAGMGKSRLCDAFGQQLANQPHLRIQYQCSPQHVNTPLHPVAGQLRHAAAIDAADDTAVNHAKLARCLAAGGIDDRGVRLVAPLLGIDLPPAAADADLPPAERRERLLATLLHYIRTLSRTQPVWLHVEDAHWIDPTTQELIARVADGIADWPVLMVVTFRPEYRAPWTGQSTAASVTLERLPRPQVVAMLRLLADWKSLPEAAIEHIVSKTDGVPLFVEEMFRGLTEAGFLVEDAESFRLARPLDTEAVPATLQDALMARLDRLASARTVAQVAAVIGRKFSRQLLTAALDVAEDDCRSALDQLVQGRLVDRRGAAPNESYVFRHALIRDAAYNSLLRRQRREWHGRIVGALEKTQPATVATQPELVARHHQEGGNVEAAIRHWSAAGELAERRSALSEAARHFEAAMMLVRQLPESPQSLEREYDQLRSLSRVVRQTEGWNTERIRQIETRGIEIARRMGRADTVQAQSLLASFRARLAKGDFGENVEAFTAVPWGLDQIAPGERQALLFMAALNNFAIGAFATAESLAFEALELSNLIPHDPGRHFAGWSPAIALRAQLCQGLRIRGQLSRAARLSAEALAIAEQEQDRVSYALALYQEALTAETAGRMPDMLRLARSASELAESIAAGPTAAIARLALGRARVATGDVAGGVADIHQGFQRMRSLFGAVQLCWAMALAVHTLLSAGAVDEARALLASAEKTQAATRDTSMAAELLRLGGRLAERDGDADAARRSYREALEISDRQGAKLFALRAAIDLARLDTGSGSPSQAAAVLQPVLESFTGGADCPEVKDADVLLRQLAAA